jgi:hypothetical protein
MPLTPTSPPEYSDMLPSPDLATTTSVLLIDSSKKQRTYWADQLKRCSPDYEIVEASDAQGWISTGLGGSIAWYLNFHSLAKRASRHSLS